MTSTFIRHELKAFWRARNTGKSIAVHIIMGFFILLLLVYVIVAGIFLDVLLKQQLFPKDDVVFSFCGVILLYFLF